MLQRMTAAVRTFTCKNFAVNTNVRINEGSLCSCHLNDLIAGEQGFLTRQKERKEYLEFQENWSGFWGVNETRVQKKIWLHPHDLV